MCLSDSHQGPLQAFQMVGLLASPLSITQGSRKRSPQTAVGAILQGLLLITQGSLEWSLRISVHQDADLMLEAEHPVTYLHLLTYHR